MAVSIAVADMDEQTMRSDVSMTARPHELLYKRNRQVRPGDMFQQRRNNMIRAKCGVDQESTLPDAVLDLFVARVS